MRTYLTIVVIGLAMILSAAVAQAADAPPAQPRLRIGVYNTRAIALAYGRGEEHNKWVSDLVKQADQAKAANDQQRLANLKAEGQAEQNRLHGQVFGNAPIDNILPLLKDAFPAVARDFGVMAIVPSVDFHDPSVEVVDVTDALVHVFKPTEKTRQVIQELVKHPPMDLQELAKHEH